MSFSWKGPRITNETSVKYSHGTCPRLVYTGGFQGVYPIILGASHLNLNDGFETLIRPSKCFKGLFFPSWNYEIKVYGKWHRVQLYSE